MIHRDRLSAVVLSTALVVIVARQPASAQVANAGPVVATLDDSGTVVVNPSLRMRWRRLVPGRGFDNTVIGETEVNVHLSAVPWIGRRVRIYMTLGRGPTAAGPDVRAEWPAGVTMLAGAVTSGGRALVFAGIVRAAALSDTLHLALSADGRQLTTPTALDFRFQIEADR